jgi:hypothetical protein
MEKFITLTAGRVGKSSCTYPYRGVKVNMEDEDATARKFGVPPYRLTVLHDVILTLTSIITD